MLHSQPWMSCTLGVFGWGAAPSGQARRTQPPGVFPVGSGPQLTAVQRVE